ncbi:MAG: GWxTD domain-containing protein [Acidobacteriota bacterium]
MKKLSFILPLLAVALASLPAAADKQKLPETYRKWIDDDVAVIATSVEREVFLKLQTDRERDLFIEAFWKQRDPTPDSPENEYKTEYYRRLEYVDRYFGRDAPRPGRKTDRGRIYLILGEPREIQRFEAEAAIYDAEVWFYQGKSDMGLPAGFNVVFFRRGGHGEYKLYSPVADGPQALLTGYYDTSDYATAYEKLRQAEPNLAAVSLSLIPGEAGATYGRPSMSSDLLIQKIESAPARSVESRYASKFLQYKDVVEVEYTANYLESDSLIKVFRDASGPYFVHYSLEPRRLSMNQYESKFYTTLKVNGRVTTTDGRLVHQFDKTVSLSLTEDQAEGARQAPFDFQDLFPLLGGDYRVSILMKNEVSKEFTTVEQTLRIPQGGSAVQLTQPLLGYRVVRLEPAERKMKAFRMGPFQITCQPSRIFTQHDTLAVAFQLNDAADDLVAGGEIRISFLKDGQPFRDIVRKFSECPDMPNVVEQFPLADFPPAHYVVRVSVAKAGAEIVSASEEFDLTFVEAVPRPWFSTRVLPDAGNPVYSEITGAQLFNLGRLEESRIVLERACQRMPESEGTAINLAKVYLALGRAADASRIIAPFIGRTDKAASYESSVLAAEALKRTGDFGRALDILDQAVAHYGVNADLMNSMGECHIGLGKPKEALAAFRKSLELSPNQPAVKKKIEELEKRK